MLDPTNKHGTKTAYTNLRNFLYGDGYLRIGTELFMRVVSNRKAAEKHLKRIEDYNPGTGTVRIIQLTEKQYAKMKYLTGGPDTQETIVGARSHIVV